MRLFLFISIFILVNPSFAFSQHFLWPTDSGQYLSSTFGETRSAHFHAGLDIKTWGREGYLVFASRDGILHRVLVTERGYGKAIYLKHADGSFTVYAHLQRFTDKFQALADSIRLTGYSFEMDAKLDSLGIQVQQGDIIGFSGSSGIGPPHLHFEVRDSLDNPINALTTNLHIKDELSPVFSSLIIEPLSKQSRIDGKPISGFMRPVSINNGVYDFGDFKLTGQAGIAVNVYDKANDVHNAYAIHSLTLLHKTDTLFYEELNTFSYENSGEMFLDRIAPFGSTRRGHQRLYGKDGHQNPFYQLIRPGARIRPAAEPRSYTIVARDYFGNKAVAKFSVTQDLKPKNEPLSLTLPPKDWFWSENWISTDLNNTLSLTQDIHGFPWNEHQQIIYPDSGNSIMFARIYPDEKQKIQTPDYRMVVRFGDQAFFDTLSVATYYEIKDEEVQISIQPQMLAAKSSFGIEFYLGDLMEPNHRYRLFRKKSSTEELSYVDSKLIGRTLHANPSQLGEFSIKADNEPPQISDFRIFETDYDKWFASVQVKDELTGINSKSAEFIINGKRGIAEYDFEENTLLYYLPGFAPEEKNRAQISLEDKAGNRVSVILEKQMPGFSSQL